LIFDSKNILTFICLILLNNTTPEPLWDYLVSNYEAVAGKGLDKKQFENKPGTFTASHGTITVSNATPETRLIVEEKAPKPDTSTRFGKKEEESAAAKARVKSEQRFTTSFTITQA